MGNLKIACGWTDSEGELGGKVRVNLVDAFFLVSKHRACSFRVFGLFRNVWFPVDIGTTNDLEPDLFRELATLSVSPYF